MNESANQLFSADDALGWRALEQQIPRPAKAWQVWLRDPASLTRRLQILSRGDFQVEVWEETWHQSRVPTLSSCFRPHVLRQRMWSRKVVLYGCGEPWVTAHSLVPQGSLRGSLRQLRVMNDKPLGAFLFRHRGLRRGAMEVAPAGDGWGRRSLFYLAGRPILVAEFFLPALIRQAERQHNRGQ